MAAKFDRNDQRLLGDVICLDSFDGAEHSRSNKKRVSLISFSSQLFSKTTLAMGSSTSSSFNIFTWQQVMSEEKESTIFPAVKSVFQEKGF